jgi:hypothetical protein
MRKARKRYEKCLGGKSTEPVNSTLEERIDILGVISKFLLGK